MLPARPLVLAAAVLSLTLAACSPPDPQHKASAALADGVLLPAYAAWADADRQLAESAAAFCAGQQELPEARQAFLAAQRGWSALQPLQLGPLAEGNLAWQVQFWPDKKNLVARQVEELLTRTPQLSQADLDQGSVVVQGLSAYEYVLFDQPHRAGRRRAEGPLLPAAGDHRRASAGAQRPGAGAVANRPGRVSSRRSPTRATPTSRKPSPTCCAPRCRPSTG